MHSQVDEVVDISHAHVLKAAVPDAELVVFKDCSHAELFRDRSEEYLQALTRFLQQRWVTALGGEKLDNYRKEK